MSRQDPIADMLTAIRNACMVQHETVTVPASGIKESILNILVEEGYIKRFERKNLDGHDNLVILLKYTPEGDPVIKGIERMSKPGLRSYSPCADIPRVRSGFGHVIVTTSEGVMTDRMARRKRIGGELLVKIW